MDINEIKKSLKAHGYIKDSESNNWYNLINKTIFTHEAISFSILDKLITLKHINLTIYSTRTLSKSLLIKIKEKFHVNDIVNLLLPIKE
jgi:hypothetical protein